MRYSVVTSGGDARPCGDRLVRGEFNCCSLHMVKAPLDQNDAQDLNTPRGTTTTDLEASSGQVGSLSSSDAAAEGEPELHASSE